jgi:general secretion pathway protein I
LSRPGAHGFTLVEVLVALVIVALGLTALMLAVSGTANASGYLRDKALAQMIAMNRIVEVRLNLQKPSTSSPTGNGTGSDTGELDFANRHWHYDTRYYDTDIPSMQRVVVRVWPGTADSKGNPLAEYIGFTGKALGLPGGSNIDWTQGSLPPAAPAPGTAPPGTLGQGSTGTGTGTTGTGTTGTGTTGTNPTGTISPSNPNASTSP